MYFYHDYLNQICFFIPPTHILLLVFLLITCFPFVLSYSDTGAAAERG
jgi:hypothetical protein